MFPQGNRPVLDASSPHFQADANLVLQEHILDALKCRAEFMRVCEAQGATSAQANAAIRPLFKAQDALLTVIHDLQSNYGVILFHTATDTPFANPNETIQ